MRLDSELEISHRPHRHLLNGRLSSERLSDGRAPPTGDGSDMSDVVVARVEALVSAAAPLRRALAKVAGRLVATRSWERLGFARLRDYAVERLGVSGRHLQELARVDGALTELPGVDAALSAGQLSWTQARLLCRVTTRESEASWLDAAAGMSAQALAREVRAVDARAIENGGSTAPASSEDEEVWPRETVQLHCSAPTRGKWCHTRQLANRIAGERLSPSACAEAVTAEVLSTIGLDAEIEVEGDDAPASASVEALSSEASRAAPPRASRSRPSLPPGPAAFVEPLIAGLESVDAFELDARLRRAMALERRHLASLGPWLLAVASKRLFRDLGYRGFDDYVREELGMSATRARALLRIERIALRSLAFCKRWREGRITWTQAQALAPLLVLEESHPWHRAWIERADRVTVRRLEEDVDSAVASGELDPAALPSLPAAFSASVPVSLREDSTDSLAPLRDASPAGHQTGARPRVLGGSVRLFFNAPRDVARLFRAALASVQRRIERITGCPSSEGEAFGAMLDHALESWGSQRPQRERSKKKYRVFERDGWRCTVPGCTSYRGLQDHHTTFRSAGGTDDLENRTTLCASHHLRGVLGEWSGAGARRRVGCVLDWGCARVGLRLRSTHRGIGWRARPR